MDFRVGRWLVRPSLNLCVRGRQTTHLTPKAMELLVCLARREGEVATKEEIFGEVWPAVFVSEDALTRCVAELRRALGDDAREPAVIGTVVKRGYRILVPVTWETDSTAPAAGLAEIGEDNPDIAPVPPPQSSRRRAWLWAGAALVLLAALLVGINWTRLRAALARRKTSPVERIAVLPLTNLSNDREQEYFADGMTDELITELARLNRWQVISRTSVMRYKGSQKGVPEIARDLAADAIIEGSVLRSGTKVRITAQLIDPVADTHRWAGSFEGEMGDVVSLQGRVAREVAVQIAGRLRQDELNRARPRPRVSPEAYDAYLKGWHLLNQRQSDKAASLFEEATLKDPHFALAHAMLYEAAAMMSFARNAPLSDRALKAMRRAQELDDNLSEVHTNIGDYEFYWNWNWAAAEAEFRRAVELDPGSVYTALHYAACQHGLGRWDEAIREYRRALRLDPLSDRLHEALISALVDAHRYGEALEEFNKTVELFPKDARAFRGAGAAYAGLGREADAIGAYLKADRLSGQDAEKLTALERSAAAGGLRGYRKELLRQLEKRAKLHPAGPMAWAYAYAAAGARDQAISMLEAAYQQRAPQLTWIRARSAWDACRPDPRFQALLRKMRFPE